MELAIKEVGRMEEYIPSDIREKYHIAELNFAMKNIHFPENFESYNIARERFVFEELLVLQLALSGRKDINTSQDGIVFEDINCVREFTDNLPFSLTNAQKKTLNEILKDCKSGKMMNRLVQGDVGSGKTAVAAAAIYTAVKNGHQAAMMAPTEDVYKRQTYDYTLKLAKHKALTGKVTVAKSGETKSVYKFENIASDVNKATLVHAYYKADKTLDSVTTTDVDIQNGTYTVDPVEKTGCTEKYMLWDSTQGMKPVSTAKLETTEVTNDKDLVLEYVGEAVATKAELGGGEDYIYLCLLYTSR